MKKRQKGILSNDNIDHNSEVFDYIRELHEYLWKFTRCEFPGAGGQLSDYVDRALLKAEARRDQVLKRGSGFQAGCSFRFPDDPIGYEFERIEYQGGVPVVFFYSGPGFLKSRSGFHLSDLNPMP